MGYIFTIAFACEVHLAYDEQDGKIGSCVLFTGKATGNYGNLTDVNLCKNAEVADF